jgi:putative endonuclease
VFTVYVLYSATYKKIYIGFTSSLEERIRSHNELGTKGWTVRYRPWTLIHKEIFESKAEALRREKELKTAKYRQWIWSLVKEA